MTDDLGGFHAPLFQRPTPPAIKAAGARLMSYAQANNIPLTVPILEMTLIGEADQVAQLAEDQRLLEWYLDQQDDRRER